MQAILLDWQQVRQLVEEAQNGSEEAKSALIAENSALIKSIIKRFQGKGLEYDDLYQLGCLGFVKAIKNFNPAFNVKFSTYVVPMVIGEIKRFMRDDGSIKVSRAIKSLNLKINKFVDAFFLENKVKPTIQQIAKHFGVEEGDVILAMDCARMPISLYAPFDDGENEGLMLIDRVEGDGGDDALVDKITLHELIKDMPKRDKTIILMRYFYDKTQSEIAQVLKISQVQVSRLENKILQSLKKKLS